MTQRNFKDWPIDPYKTSGIDLAEIINDAVEAADTNNAGNTRPSYLEAGGIWSKGSAETGGMDLYLFDGQKDVLIGGSASGDGGMVISDSPPVEPSVGDMWLRTPQMIVFVWNGDYWFQFPEHLGGAGGGGSGDINVGLSNGDMTYWDGGSWVPTSAASIRNSGSGTHLSVLGELQFRSIKKPNEYRGGVLRAEYFEDVDDRWENQKLNWNMTWIRPLDDNSDPKRRNGFDVRADRFMVRLADNPENDPWDEGNIVLRCDRKDIDLGMRDYSATVHIFGDTYCGMSQNFMGKKIPGNPDNRPGTMFNGGMMMIGSYIEGQSLNPIYNGESPSEIRDRAFLKDSGIDMVKNPIYGLADPDEPAWAGIRESMPPTMKWLKENSLVADADGVLVSKGSTRFGNSNDDEHQFMGDVYCGFVGDNLPDTGAGDTVPGTLFLARGLKLVAEGNFDPSIHCNGNHIIQVKSAAENDHAPNWGQVKGLTRSLKQTICEAISRSQDFESLKENLLSVLSEVDEGE